MHLLCSLVDEADGGVDRWLKTRSRLVGYCDICHSKVPQRKRIVVMVSTGYTLRFVDRSNCLGEIKFSVEFMVEMASAMLSSMMLFGVQAVARKYSSESALDASLFSIDCARLVALAMIEQRRQRELGFFMLLGRKFVLEMKKDEQLMPVQSKLSCFVREVASCLLLCAVKVRVDVFFAILELVWLSVGRICLLGNRGSGRVASSFFLYSATCAPAAIAIEIARRRLTARI